MNEEKIIKGFNASIYTSIPTEISIQTQALKKLGYQPCKIHLGPLATEYFIKQHRHTENYLGMPVMLNCPWLSGVWVQRG